MRFIVNHDPSNYVAIAVRFWFAKLIARITRQRRSLSINLLVAFLLLYAIKPSLGIGLIVLIFLVLLIDLMITINEAYVEKRKTKSYLDRGGGHIEIYTNGYFSYFQHNREYKRVIWSDIYEYCRLNSPQALSFKSKTTKEVYIISGMEMTQNDFLTLKQILESSISIQPLV